MRVTVVHNEYESSQPSGENRAVADDIDALREAGVDVDYWSTSSDALLKGSRLGRSVRTARMATSPILDRRGGRDFAQFLANRRPDLVHVHNLYPAFSPMTIRTSKRLGIPVVHTLHNYRRQCVKGTFYRDGAICMECNGRAVPSPAVLHGCYRSSRLQTVPMAVSLALHRGSWAMVDCNLVLTEFQREWLVSQGVDRGRIVVRPTPARSTTPSNVYDKRVAFVGRLSAEKGPAFLLQAWGRSRLPEEGWHLDVLGDGPLMPELRNRWGGEQSVTLHGETEPREVDRLTRTVAAVVVPSLWFEGFPRVVSDAFARARPVLAVRNVNMDSIVGDCGWVAARGVEFVAALDGLRRADEVRRRGSLARLRFESTLTREISTQNLLECYRRVTCA